MAIIGYARASTEDQKLDAQIEQLKEAKSERDSMRNPCISRVSRISCSISMSSSCR
ncbi:MAG: recombinase family protein [Geobacteraceae bacterium]|nr:recombinase family protein [Geobacteraceae bacterium]